MSGYRENAKLTAYALGELGQRESKGVEREVRGCDDAREAADEILEVAALLREEFDAEPGLFLTAEQREAILRGEASRGAQGGGVESDDPAAEWDHAGAEVGREQSGGGVDGDGRTKRTVTIDGRGWFLGALSTSAAAMLMVAFWQVVSPGGGIVEGESGSDGMQIEIGLLEPLNGDPRPLAKLPDSDGSEASVLWPQVSVVNDVRVDYEMPGKLSSDGFAAWSADEFAPGRRPTVARVSAAHGDVGTVSEIVSGAPVELAPMPSASAPYGFLAPLRGERGGYEAGGYWYDGADLIPSSGRSAVINDGAVGGVSAGAYLSPLGEPLSAIPLSYDPSGYANLRHFVMEYNMLPPQRLVSLGDLVNYFDYGYTAPMKSSSDAVRTSIEVAECPWAPERLLVRIGIKAKQAEPVRRGRNLALLLDTSQSMLGATKMPVIQGSVESMLDSMRKSDRVAVIPFGGPFGFHLDPTPVSSRDRVTGTVVALGSGVGDADKGLSLDEAVLKAGEVFNDLGGVDQVVVVTDSLTSRRIGGRSVPRALMPLQKSAGGVAVIGVGAEILEEGELLEEVASSFDYHHAGTLVAGRRAFDQVGRAGAEVVVAKKVKADVEFNPQAVRAYRLLAGMADQEDDTKGAGVVHLKSGQEVTALYEVIPMGGQSIVLASDKRSLKYEHLSEELRELARGADARRYRNELMTVRIGYQEVGGGGGSKRRVVEDVVGDQKRPLSDTTDDFRFAAGVAGYGMLVSGYGHAEDISVAELVELIENSSGANDDRLGMRREFLELLRATWGMVSR